MFFFLHATTFYMAINGEPKTLAENHDLHIYPKKRNFAAYFSFLKTTDYMRVIVQRTTRACVRIDSEVVGSIDQGFMLLVGITHTDSREDADYIAKKVAQLRVFEDEAGKMNLSIKDIGGSILSISQFTLYGDVRHGNRPSFIQAARPEQAQPLYDYFNQSLREVYGLQVATGHFGADMQVDFINSGPVTILIDSANR